MCTIVSRLDIVQIFCDGDDFCKQWENLWQQVPQLPSTKGERRSTSRMHLSEVMTIAMASPTPLCCTRSHELRGNKYTSVDNPQLGLLPTLLSLSSKFQLTPTM
ncbi:MAG: hypothetical protein V7L24_01200 [Nostoc sp.]